MSVLLYTYIYLFISVNTITQLASSVMHFTVSGSATGSSTTSQTDDAVLHKRGMLKSMSHRWLRYLNTNQRNYGISVSNVDNDEDNRFELFVAGYDGPNMVLQFDKTRGGINNNQLINIAKEGTPYELLADPVGQAIGVAACDLDGDSKEEIYVLNTNNAFAGQSSYGDKLFKWRGGKYVDLYSDPVNEDMEAKDYSGRSVACIDRYGNGKYGFLISTYALSGAGSFSLIEMDETHPDNDKETGHIVLKNVAHEAKIDQSTGGRAVTVGPIVSEGGKSDIFFGNEGNEKLGNKGANFLYRNLGNGSFYDVARDVSITDSTEAVRGVSLADFNNDGLFDIVYGNWNGEHRLFLQETKGTRRNFIDCANSDLKKPSPVRTVLVADFDNDGNSEIFLNNIVMSNRQSPNRLFTVINPGKGEKLDIKPAELGDAEEPDGYGTGAAVVDINNDGFLDLITSHGEGQRQPLEVGNKTHILDTKNIFCILDFSC